MDEADLVNGRFCKVLISKGDPKGIPGAMRYPPHPGKLEILCFQRSKSTISSSQLYNVPSSPGGTKAAFAEKCLNSTLSMKYMHVNVVLVAIAATYIICRFLCTILVTVFKAQVNNSNLKKIQHTKNECF